MGLDFKKLNVGGGGGALTNPREIFAALPTRASKYSYLRDVQAEVLDQWYDRREEPDLVIKMNTGGGKTVVGLLALASSLNENAGPALYLTPDKYLADQVVAEAQSLGVATTDNPRSPEYQLSQAICVTTVQRLFNGKSIFGLADQQRIPIGTLLIDDAHACLAIVREQFSVSVPSASSQYAAITKLMLPALDHQSRANAEQLKDGDPTVSMLVPHWAWASAQAQVVPLLAAARDEEWMKFQWPLVRDVIDLCRVAVTSNSIVIAPPCLPVEVIPSFRLAKRRIYLTATLSDDSILVTDFAANVDSITKPITPNNAGDLGDRMILSPLETHPKLLHEDLRQLALRLSKDRNVVVLVPSSARAKIWSDVTTEIHLADTLHAIVAELRTRTVGLVVLVNKYDGVDLPDDACRVLIIDGLPTAWSPLERIEAASLDGTEKSIQRQLQKVEQGMGRGVRSNEDHCVVILSDPRLASIVWSNGERLFSAATAAQLGLSRQVANMLRGTDVPALEDAIHSCLDRDPDWVSASRGALATLKNPKTAFVSETAVAERRAFDLAALGRHQEAVDDLRTAINGISEKSLRGWIKQQAAAYMSLYDPAKASDMQRSAQEDNRMLLRPPDASVARRLLKASLPQAEAAAAYLAATYESPQHFLIGVEAVLADLQPDPDTTEAFERAMVDLALHLGFAAQRPERELGIGPDVLWALGDLRFLVIECKSGATTSAIGKRDLAQLGHSHDWFSEAYDSTCAAAPVMIHPVNTCAADAVAAAGTRVVTFDKLTSLVAAVRAWSVAVASVGSFESTDLGRRLVEYNLHAGAFPNEWTVPPKRSR